jgi:hypothetical protein
VPLPVDLNAVPFVRWLVAAFGLVCTMTHVVRDHLSLCRTNATLFRATGLSLLFALESCLVRHQNMGGPRCLLDPTVRMARDDQGGSRRNGEKAL